jgi:hypothetical protein
VGAQLTQRSATVRPIAGAAFGAFVMTRVAARVIEDSWLAHRAGWVRSNYRQRTVSLTGGASAAAASVLAAAVFAPCGWRPAAVAVTAAAAGAGLYDDLLAPAAETASDKGWRGHLSAARAGRVSGGAVKVAVIGVAALGAARSISVTWASALPKAALIAGTANLVNLFDLRPGRAAKVVLVTGALGLASPIAAIAAIAVGAAAAELPADLAERQMLGDLGANTLGALLGLRLAGAPPARRWTALAVVLGLTAVSERISFSAVIDGNRVLRQVDRWGRSDQPPL